MQIPVRGKTLLDLLMTLAIIGILVSLVAPDLGRALQRQTGAAVISDLARTLNQARAAAVSSGSIVTLCRSDNGASCGGQWEDGMLLFTDANGDRVMNQNDQMLRLRSIARAGTLRLRSFPNRQYLQFTPPGFTNRQNGSFTWCPHDNAPQEAQQLIFTQAGRVRIARDNDGDGIREDASGQPLTCP